MSLSRQPRAFVTGAGSGLGRALCLALAPRGARILVTDVQTEAAEETAGMVRARGGDAVARRCDVSDPEQVRAAADEMDSRWEGTDLVVNNAGVAAAGRIGDISLEDWHWIAGVNLWGVIHGCHAFAPRLRRQGSGHFLNVASAAGFVSAPEMGSYNVTKAGVIALSETLHGELRPAGVGVTVLCPSFFTSNLLASFRSPEARQRRMAEQAFEEASMNAEQVSRAALRAVERGRLYCLPQRDARLGWWLKRVMPERFYRLVVRRHQQMAAEAGQR